MGTLIGSRIRLGLFLLAAAIPMENAAAQAIAFPPFLELRVPKPPTVATAGTGSFLAYELHVTNFAIQTVTLKRVEVSIAGSDGARRALLTVGDSTLGRSISRPGTTTPLAEHTRLAGGARAVVFLWVPIERGSPPALVQDRVTVEQGAGDSGRTQELDGPAVPVLREAAPTGPPLRGGVWLIGNGPAAESGHRWALVATGGTPTIAQRFAIDYVKIGDDFRTHTGDSLKNENYYAYGNDALAVADGIVVATKDGIPQNVPGATSRAVPITLETVGGNHVVIDLGNGRYAFYAHLQPGSLTVRVGDRVKRGQVVGLVGNSGNSTEPHLHFHVGDGISPLGSEGIPYGLDGFEIVGHCKRFGSGCERSAAVIRHGEVPLDNTLIQFPK
jgi:murein DD-endopeptidase MepM/ murein hydrolase activator NlpD